MSPEITVKKDYILIEPKIGADFWEIQRGIARLFYVSEIPKKPRIWLFREGPQKLAEDDLYKIRDILKKNYPENSGIKKRPSLSNPGCSPAWPKLLNGFSRTCPMSSGCSPILPKR